MTADPSIPADTSPDAHATQLEAYRRMGGAERLQVMYRLNEITRSAALAGIRHRHPAYSEEQALLALARMLHGDELVQRAWPGRPLVDP